MDDWPFSGMRVYDASMGVAGPYCTYLMACYGADVIKVEPSTGDWGRKIGNQYDGIGSIFLSYNRGKRSIALDLKSSRGAALARALATQCDVIVESFRPGTMDRLGMGYEVLAKDRPDLVYLSVSGFGQRGPYAKLPAMDPMIQAFSGWLDLNRDVAGNPVLMKHVPVDVVTGLYAFQALSAALLRRFRFGKGGYIDANLMQSAAAFLAPRLADFVMSGGPPPEAAGVPMGVFPTGDGMLSIAVKDDKEFGLLCEAMQMQQWYKDPCFASRAARIANKAAMHAALNAKLAERSAQDWQTIFREKGLAAAKVQSAGEFLDDPHTRATGIMRLVDQPGHGPTPLVPIPGFADVAPARFSAPAIGEHTKAVLSELGQSEASIASILEDRIAMSA